VTQALKPLLPIIVVDDHQPDESEEDRLLREFRSRNAGRGPLSDGQRMPPSMTSTSPSSSISSSSSFSSPEVMMVPLPRNGVDYNSLVDGDGGNDGFVDVRISVDEEGDQVPRVAPSRIPQTRAPPCFLHDD
jgi:hypothetical protein